jgi:hypothetical protein
VETQIAEGQGGSTLECVRTQTSTKRRYRLRNWPDYNAALVRRGSLTVWFDAEAIAGWAEQQRPGERRRRGRPRTYSDVAITVMLTLKAVYGLKLRSTEGFTQDLMQLLGLPLAVPDYSTLSRRQATLAVAVPVRPVSEPLHWVVDSTGLKLYGEGEWKVRRFGWTCHRRWLKLHLAINPATHEVRAVGASTNNVTDGEMLPLLLAAEAAPLAQVTGDGSYDEWRCWDAVAARPERPRAVFPPPRMKRGASRRWALIRQHGNTRARPLDRDEAIRHIRRVGRRQWKRDVGYHERSLAETAVWRWKRIIGPEVHARAIKRQMTEVFIGAAVLNRMTELGMPESHAA